MKDANGVQRVVYYNRASSYRIEVVQISAGVLNESQISRIVRKLENTDKMVSVEMRPNFSVRIIAVELTSKMIS